MSDIQKSIPGKWDNRMELGKKRQSGSAPPPPVETFNRITGDMEPRITGDADNRVIGH
jgi:hypothetical protein